MRTTIIGPIVNRDNIEDLEQKIISVIMELPKPTTLIAGGSPLVDHISVLLFLRHRQQFPQLKLCLPARIDPKTGYFDSSTTDGKLLNEHHTNKSRKELVECIAAGAEVTIHNGILARNVEIINNCDMLIAASFSPNEPLPGTGTAWTWQIADPNKIDKKYINLHDIRSFDM